MLELLISITILSVIVAIIYASLVTVTDTAEAARANNETLRFRQFLWRSFSTNLTSVYVDPACEVAGYQFVGEDETGPSGPADVLRFCTSLPLSGPWSLPGVMRVVTYEVMEAYEAEGESSGGGFSIDASADEAGSGLYLVVREQPLMLEDQDFDPDMEAAGQTGIERKVPIASMDILYYDAELEEWAEKWDSMAQARLPWAVRIMINFARSEDEAAADYQAGINPLESADLDMTIALPLGAGVVEPFFDLNHQRQSGEFMDDGKRKNKKTDGRSSAS
jgi:type II secretory pathway pseudopilin PulG